MCTQPSRRTALSPLRRVNIELEINLLNLEFARLGEDFCTYFSMYHFALGDGYLLLKSHSWAKKLRFSHFDSSANF